MTDKPKRPKDANQFAHMIIGIATGEDIEYEPDTSGNVKVGLEQGNRASKSLNEGF